MGGVNRGPTRKRITKLDEYVEVRLAGDGVLHCREHPGGEWTCKTVREPRTTTAQNRADEGELRKMAPCTDTVAKSAVFAKARAIEERARDTSLPMAVRMPTPEDATVIAKRDAFAVADQLEHATGARFDEVVAAVHERAVAKLRKSDPELTYEIAYGDARRQDAVLKTLYILGAHSRVGGMEFGAALQHAATHGGAPLLGALREALEGGVG